MATLKEIATKSEISISTVSRVLKNDRTLQISAGTRAKILKVASELGYKAKAKTVNGVKIAIINWYSHDDEIVDPYYYYIRKAVESECLIQNLTYDTYYKEHTFKNINNYDGIIAIGKFSKKQAKELQLISEQVIFVDYNPDHDNFDSVEIDFDKLMKDIIDYVVAQKNTSVGLMIGVESVDNQAFIDPRQVFFEKYTKVHNLYNEKYYITGEFTLESGYEMFMKLYENKTLPQVLICGNDLIAMGANKAAYKMDLKVGEDLKIIGINDIPMSKYMVPSLTTVKIYQKEMGKEAVKLLKRRLAGDEGIKIKIIIPTKLKVRKST
ncbi:MAG: LacI family DNA-binding transcriptional regulator [Mycoplasmatales bacterium]